MGGGRSGIFGGFAAIKCAAIVVVRVLSGVLVECWGAGKRFRRVCQLSRCAALGVAGLIAAKPVAGGLSGGVKRGFAAIRSATRARWA